MSKRVRPQQAPPDLFADVERRSSSAGAKSPAKISEPKHRYILPHNLAGALERLSDAEFEKLAAAISKEQRRRNLPISQRRATPDVDVSPKVPAPSGKAELKPKRKTADPLPLTQARINAIRAAFKAGVKPTLIARQFGVSQAAVREALSEKRR
jgi:hypothetical protein